MGPCQGASHLQVLLNKPMEFGQTSRRTVSLKTGLLTHCLKRLRGGL